MKTIKLFRKCNGWFAKHDDPQVRALFGTDTIACAFMTEAEPAMVLSEIRVLNPGVSVTIETR